jgi:hypothetical protein
MDRIGTHMDPVFILDIGEIRDKEYFSSFFKFWQIGEEVR